MAGQTIGISFPFKNTYEGGVFQSTKTTADSIRSNLIAFLTLKRKQRPMRSSLYSPLFDYLFEQYDDIADDNLKKDLGDKLAEFFPEITVSDIITDFDEGNNLVHVKLLYTINSLGGAKDEVTISLALGK